MQQVVRSHLINTQQTQQDEEDEEEDCLQSRKLGRELLDKSDSLELSMDDSIISSDLSD